jgi:hypothetical protein
MFKPDIDLLINVLNKSKSGMGYDGFEKYDVELSETYEMIFGSAKLEAVKAGEGWPKDYHTCWDLLLKKKIIEDKVSHLDYIDLANRINSCPTRFYIMIDLLKHTLSNFGDILFAEKMISALPRLDLANSDGKYIGYRTLLRHFAERNDLENFKRVLPLSDGRKSPTHEIPWSKGILISKRVENDGFEAGLKLMNTRLFGNEFVLNLFRPLLPAIDLEEIDRIINNHPEFLVCHPHLKSTLYTEFAVSALKRSFDIEVFEKVLSHLSACEKESSDWEFFSLATTTEDLALIDKCRKLIRTPMVRKEVKRYVESIKEREMNK